MYGTNDDRGGGGGGRKSGDFSQIKDIREKLLNAANEKVWCMLCYVMLCYAMLTYFILYYNMICFVIIIRIKERLNSKHKNTVIT